MADDIETIDLVDTNLFQNDLDKQAEVDEPVLLGIDLQIDGQMSDKTQSHSKSAAFDLFGDDEYDHVLEDLEHMEIGYSENVASNKLESKSKEDITINHGPHRHVKFPGSGGKNKSMEFSGPSPDDDDYCAICMDSHREPKTLKKCSHSFCTDCIEEHFKIKPTCPVCFAPYGVITGNMPLGYMSNSISKTKLPGYEAYNTIVVSYSFCDGTQTAEHPNPGQMYYGTSRTAYLPNNPEGQKVLKLLKVAFDRKLTFTVGRSRTTGCDNVVTWNDIHHKTATHGGQENFGYPDPTYLSRVQEELAAKGVTEDSIK